MEYLECDCDLMRFDEELVNVCRCHECGEEFEVGEGEKPDTCPKCGIEFLPEDH